MYNQPVSCLGRCRALQNKSPINASSWGRGLRSGALWHQGGDFGGSFCCILVSEAARHTDRLVTRRFSSSVVLPYGRSVRQIRGGITRTLRAHVELTDRRTQTPCFLRLTQEDESAVKSRKAGRKGKLAGISTNPSVGSVGFTQENLRPGEKGSLFAEQ